jgi:tetratricopeptide (TPR) repeat protein
MRSLQPFSPPARSLPDSATLPRRSSLFGLMLLVLLQLPLSAQQAEGDAAWSEGRFDVARAAYEQVLARDPAAVRANLRLGIMLSWDGKLDSALVLLARARAAEPADADIRLAEARVMAWDGRYSAALARYDSLLAERPDLREAALGRARTLGWAGRLKPAADAYRAVLAKDSRDVDALVGLGYVLHWEGRHGAAVRAARAALAIDSTHQEARELDRRARGAIRPAVETSANWSNDSDRNTTFSQSLTVSAPLADGVRVFGSAGALEASDPVLDATRIGGEVGLSYAFGKVQLTAAGGARRLNPEIAEPRTSETYRARVRVRPASAFELSVAYARAPFDEIAALIERDLDFESLDGGFDLTPAPGLNIYGGVGGAWFSDGNSRTSALTSITRTFRRRFLVGLFGRTLSYEERGIGYFSPDRFNLLEAQAGYNLESGQWDGRFIGGLGAQQIGKRGEAQSEWHLEARLARRWGVGNRIEAFGLVTNSAVSSTTGAFRYRSAGVVVRVGI